ncbi:MAG: D-alanyl-D-alanine carboxypeptidase [Clostridia bacterium]|nr:D-alanyl-D-alanine carboxypeptidase [Clostridia bacterium]
MSRILKKTAAVFLALIAAIAASAPAVCAAPSVSAQAYCLMDALDGSVILERSSHERLPMASTTKIMTALCVIRSCDPDGIVTVDKRAAGTEGSSVYLAALEKISVRELLFALLLESANDAAVALAIHVGGSEEEFAALMNSTALSLGLEDTHFVNASGLPADGHYSSAYDLALIMRECLKEPLFCSISSSKTHRSPLSGSKYRYFSNHNRLLWRYGFCTAGKTGYTREAGRCLVSSAEKDGVKLICSTICDPDDWNDHVSLFEHGFSLYDPVELCAAGELKRNVSVVGSEENFVSVVNREGLTLFLREDKNVDVVFELPFFLYAPVRAYSSSDPNVPLPVGRAVFWINGEKIGSVELYPERDVGFFEPPTLFQKILNFLGIKKL